MDREPTARHAAPLTVEAAERMSWEEVSQYHKNGYPSLGDQFCRELATHQHTAIPCAAKLLTATLGMPNQCILLPPLTPMARPDAPGRAYSLSLLNYT
jgi:hypothetical protein